MIRNRRGKRITLEERSAILTNSPLTEDSSMKPIIDTKILDILVRIRRQKVRIALSPKSNF